jgi:hypothetical protein
MKKKVYVLTVSDYLPANHPRRGESTGIEYKIKNGIKIHELRSDYFMWKKRIDEINAGLAILSIRRWSGKPYQNRQIEIMQLGKAGIQMLTNSKNRDGYTSHWRVTVDNNQFVDFITLSENEGKPADEWRSWFGCDDFRKTNGSYSLYGIQILISLGIIPRRLRREYKIYSFLFLWAAVSTCLLPTFLRIGFLKRLTTATGLTTNIYFSLKTRLDSHGLPSIRLQRNQSFALPLKATVFIPNLWDLPCRPMCGPLTCQT